MNNELYKVINLWKVFRSGNRVVEALRGIDLTILYGETLGIVGVSGAGKTTLLHILGTLDKPTSGKVYFEGRELSVLKESELMEIRNRKIGFVFQFYQLLPEFNALENVMMPLLIRGVPKKDAAEIAFEILRKTGLEGRIKHRTGELSAGEQQRVAIARALINNPKAILADEPTGNLDSITGENINELMLEINRELGTAIIIVTHNERLARKMSRVVTIHDGKIC